MMIGEIFDFVFESSINAAVVGLVLLAVKFAAGKRIPKKYHFLIWLILLFKLVFPYGPQSRVSVFNPLAEGREIMLDYADTQIAYTGAINGHINILPYIWLTGAAIMLLWFVSGYIYVIFKTRKAVSVNCDIFEMCKAKTGVKNIIPVMQSYIKSPSLFGIIKPRLFISPELESLTDKQKEHIFIHEMMHLKRKDNILNLVLIIFQAIHWFNPFLWYCFSKIRQDMEYAVDEQVLILTGENKEYGFSLLSLALSRKVPCALGFNDEKNIIKKRIKLIAAFKKVKLTDKILSMGLICVLALVCMTDAKAQMSNIKLVIPSLNYSLPMPEKKETKPDIKEEQEQVQEITEIEEEEILHKEITVDIKELLPGTNKEYLMAQNSEAVLEYVHYGENSAYKLSKLVPDKKGELNFYVNTDTSVKITVAEGEMGLISAIVQPSKNRVYTFKGLEDKPYTIYVDNSVATGGGEGEILIY